MKKNSLGFTLIELLVAITIGMVVIGFGSVALNEFNEKQKVEAVKQELLANLRLARNYAMTDQFATGGNRLLIMISSGGLMEMKAYKKDGTFMATIFSKDITPSGMSISITDSDGKDFNGDPIGGEIIKFSVSDGRSINGEAIVTITGDDGTIKIIKIDESGLIYEE